MTVEGIITGLRIYVVVVSVVVAVVGTLQLKRWRTYLMENQFAWIALALLNFATGFGTYQSLDRDIPGGSRTWITALAVTFALYAVLFEPAKKAHRWWCVRRIVQQHQRAQRRNPANSDTEESP